MGMRNVYLGRYVRIDGRLVEGPIARPISCAPRRPTPAVDARRAGAETTMAAACGEIKDTRRPRDHGLRPDARRRTTPKATRWSRRAIDAPGRPDQVDRAVGGGAGARADRASRAPTASTTRSGVQGAREVARLAMEPARSRGGDLWRSLADCFAPAPAGALVAAAAGLPAWPAPSALSAPTRRRCSSGSPAATLLAPTTDFTARAPRRGPARRRRHLAPSATRNAFSHFSANLRSTGKPTSRSATASSGSCG